MPRKRTIVGGVALATLTALYLLVASLGFQENYEDFHGLRPPLDAEADLASADALNKTSKRILLVSALFPLPKSKHSQEEYKDWLHNFLGKVTTDVYFFTPPSLEEVVLQSRSNGMYVKVNTSYPSAFSVPPLRGREAMYEELHRTKDRERARHNPDLYAIWNSKPFFLNEAVKEMRDTLGREYDYAFWVDSGSFRGGHAYENWPDPGRVESVFNKSNKSDSVFMQLYDLPRYKYRWWKEAMGPVDDEVSEGQSSSVIHFLGTLLNFNNQYAGSFFGGSPRGIDWYASTFYAYHDHYLSLGYFVGKDQTIINSILLLFPQRFVTFWRQRDPVLYSLNFPSGRCGTYWYYYEFLLANPSERQVMEGMWESWRQPGFWRNVQDWIVGRGARCPLLEPVSVDRALSRGFGFEWKTENATVVVPP